VSGIGEAAASRPFHETLPGDYRVPAGHFDELLDRGQLRPWWTAFGAHVQDLSAEGLTSAQARVAKEIHESSITHSVYAATDGRTRPWTLDLLPLIVGAAEWAPLAQGIAQHARLLNAIAADLYGPQTLLAQGVIPPALVFRHPGFLRACHGVVPPGGTHVHQVALDLARGQQGGWQVVNVRTQTPAGAGYALENRATIVRTFPDAFRELQVRAVAPYFASLRDTIVRAAPCDAESPQVVLLTPGPYSGRYFEHAYLARYFGFALVEGADLTVRHDRVFLKTIAGLRQVHAIVRHLADDYCDPLELRADSTLGVPGLVQAWRRGRVLVTNAFGTSVLQSHVLRGLLPAICERLLGEPLRLPVLPVSWRETASDDPEAAVVHAVPMPSYAPVWHDGRLESRPLLLRVFAVAGGDGSYSVMDGGLTRIAAAKQHAVMSGSGGSKDTWIVSDASAPPTPGTTPIVAHRAPDPIRDTRIVSSRAAEHLFWLGRYVERAETSARLLRTALARLSDPSLPALPRAPFFRVCIANGLLEQDEADGALLAPDLIAAVRRQLIDNMFDGDAHQSLAFNVRQTVRVAGAIRDRLSSDNWRLLNQLFALVAIRPQGRADVHEALALLERSIVSLVAVAGLEMAHMPRDDGWRFLSLGRHLERLLSVATTFASVTLEDAADQRVLEWLLDASDSLGTFRVRYVRAPEWRAVVELLLYDPSNPRSLSFQVGKIAKHVPLLPGAASLLVTEDLTRLERAAAGGDLTQADLFGGPTWMETLLDDCQRVAAQLSDALTSRYFSHAYELPHVTGMTR
jgi:uncharacterized circularly permuted ATP-grasp superfamily protein/uncharacterized alpha-E superfamily protein